MKIISVISIFALLGLSACWVISEDTTEDIDNDVQIDEVINWEDWATPPISAFPDKAFRALGTEPFWSFTYDNQNLDWSALGEEDIIEASHFVQQVFLESDAIYYITWDFIAVQIFEETCSDGMSDDIFEYTVTWNYFDMELNWCAEAL